MTGLRNRMKWELDVRQHREARLKHLALGRPALQNYEQTDRPFEFEF